jgi:hypothetical protein
MAGRSALLPWRGLVEIGASAWRGPVTTLVSAGKVTAGLNKGEARNTLARAVFFNRLGEIRDRSFDRQRYRASGLNLVTPAIVLRNTVYLDRTITTLNSNDSPTDPDLRSSSCPGTGTHQCQRRLHEANQIKPGKYRPLRRSGRL